MRMSLFPERLVEGRQRIEILDEAVLGSPRESAVATQESRIRDRRIAVARLDRAQDRRKRDVALADAHVVHVRVREHAIGNRRGVDAAEHHLQVGKELLRLLRDPEHPAVGPGEGRTGQYIGPLRDDRVDRLLAIVEVRGETRDGQVVAVVEERGAERQADLVAVAAHDRRELAHGQLLGSEREECHPHGEGTLPHARTRNPRLAGPRGVPYRGVA